VSLVKHEKQNFVPFSNLQIPARFINMWLSTCAVLTADYLKDGQSWDDAMGMTGN
jgi:hypothetical protein